MESKFITAPYIQVALKMSNNDRADVIIHDYSGLALAKSVDLDTLVYYCEIYDPLKLYHYVHGQHVDKVGVITEQVKKLTWVLFNPILKVA